MFPVADSRDNACGYTKKCYGNEFVHVSVNEIALK